MPYARISFVVPESVTSLAEAAFEHGFTFDRHIKAVDAEDFQDYETVLIDAVGSRLDAEAEDVDDPIDAVSEMIRALAAEGSDYFAVTTAFEERSRGLRCDGRLYVAMGDVSFEKVVPWSEGDPALDRRTLVLAGLDEATVAAVEERFLRPAPLVSSNSPSPT